MEDFKISPEISEASGGMYREYVKVEKVKKTKVFPVMVLVLCTHSDLKNICPGLFSCYLFVVIEGL